MCIYLFIHLVISIYAAIPRAVGIPSILSFDSSDRLPGKLLFLNLPINNSKASMCADT